MSTEKRNLWGIILAGGAGKRLLEFTKQLYGYPRPKQYCVITGVRSMLEHTLDRARLLMSPDRLITVTLQSHKKYFEGIYRDQPSEAFVVQPECRDTGPGLLLPLLKIHHLDPKSVVTVLPSDHFILENRKFMKYVEQATDFVETYPEYIVLIGVKPQRPEVEYGWIEPGKKYIAYKGDKFSPVLRFWEKPSYEMAVGLRSKGCIWNTFVLVGHASTFLKHIQKHMSEVFTPFNAIREAFGTFREEEAIKTAYLSIPSVNFSRSVLDHVSEHLYVLEVSAIYWGDWGNEDRIRLDVEQLDLRLSSR
jgi:mannose-1-phosphate guanylyltransferase